MKSKESSSYYNPDTKTKAAPYIAGLALILGLSGEPSTPIVKPSVEVIMASKTEVSTKLSATFELLQSRIAALSTKSSNQIQVTESESHSQTTGKTSRVTTVAMNVPKPAANQTQAFYLRVANSNINQTGKDIPNNSFVEIALLNNGAAKPGHYEGDYDFIISKYQDGDWMVQVVYGTQSGKLEYQLATNPGQDFKGSPLAKDLQANFDFADRLMTQANTVLTAAELEKPVPESFPPELHP